MRSDRARVAKVVAAVMAIVAVATGCTPTGGEHVDAGAIEAIAVDLPADPAAAAEHLVAEILAESGDHSVAATAELLRRSGHAIVSAHGSVVAMPDGLAMIDAPVYVELVPMLTAATRAGDRYSLEQFAALLTATGLTELDATPAQVAAAIAGWAKEVDDHPIFQSAAAGIRALAGHRGQVLYAGVQPGEVSLDPLQTILLLGHATSRFGEVDHQGGSPTASGPGVIDWLLGTAVAHAADPAGPCGELASLFATPDDPVIKANSAFLKGELKGRLAQEFLSEGTKEAFDKAGEAWGKAGAVVSAIMLLLGARLDLSADKTSTHFKHVSGSRAEHVTITARAVFDPKIALEKLECYALAGIEVPKPGPMKDMTVRWSSEQPQMPGLQEAGNQLLQTVSADSIKIQKGAKTGADGTATLEVMPPVENPAGEGEELRGKALFIASLDKENFPFELGDLYGLLNAVGFGIGKTFDLVKEVLVKAGLPSQTITIDVKYHGSDIIIAHGSNDVNLILAKLPGVYVDLVSCAGVAGPFTGTAGYDGATSSDMLHAAGAITGVPVPKQFAGDNKTISVLTNDRKGPNPFFIMSGEGGAQFLDGVLTFYPSLNNSGRLLSDYRLGFPVGEVEVLLGGSTFPLSDLSWPVYRVREDPRCEKVTYKYDRI